MKNYFKNNLLYNSQFISKKEKEDIINWLKTIYPIWEDRYSEHNPPPAGDTMRSLLRPVYWLGNWQFACLNYYHPPKGIENRCIKAEEYPPCLKFLVKKMEEMTRKLYKPTDVPKNWELNTCLINFYGSKIVDGKKIDGARVGDHKDFEPGQTNVILEQWLDDPSLFIFAGELWKTGTFHRVQRVDKKTKLILT